MGKTLKKGALYLFDCDLDGKTNPNDGKKHKKHFFIILSHELYNRKMNSYLGVGLSSNTDQSYAMKLPMEQFSNWSGAINSGKYRAFDGATQLTCLADKVCRLKEDDLLFTDDKLSLPLLTVTEKAYEQIIKHISNFMKIPNDDPNV